MTTKIQKVKNDLLAGKVLSHAQALTDYGYSRLSDAIHVLRKRGMLQWRDEVKEYEKSINNKTVDYFNGLWNEWHLSDSGEEEILKLTKKYGVIKVLNGIDTAYEIYNKKGRSEEDNFTAVIDKVGSIVYLNDAPEHKKAIAYIKGILRNKFNYINERIASIELEKYYKNGYDLQILKDKLQNGELNRWVVFKEFIQEINNYG